VVQVRCGTSEMWYKCDKVQINKSTGGNLIMSKPVKVTDVNFKDEVLSSDQKVLVDFWAEWCGPCRMVAPVVEDIASEYSDQIKVAKLNVDENQTTASRYGIMSIPTMLVMEDGKVKDKLVGYMPKDKLVNKLKLK